MQKIDRLGWAAGVSFICQGVRVGIRVNDPKAVGWLLAVLPPGAKPLPSPVVDELCSVLVAPNVPGSRLRRFHLFYWGADRLARTLDAEELFAALQTWLHFIVALGARRHVFVKAGVVGWGGRAIVLLGRPSAGTTTLVAALVRAGAIYFSDRYAVLDRRGRVHPYPSPLASGEEVLGCIAAARALPVGLVVVTGYRPGARWRPRVLSAGEAMLALLGNAVQARLRPRAVLTALRAAVAGAAALRGKRGEAEEAAGAMLKRLDGPVQPGSPGGRRPAGGGKVDSA
jgi:hypothetical protein